MYNSFDPRLTYSHFENCLNENERVGYYRIKNGENEFAFERNFKYETNDYYLEDKSSNFFNFQKFQDDKENLLELERLNSNRFPHFSYKNNDDDEMKFLGIKRKKSLELNFVENFEDNQNPSKNLILQNLYNNFADQTKSITQFKPSIISDTKSGLKEIQEYKGKTVDENYDFLNLYSKSKTFNLVQENEKSLTINSPTYSSHFTCLKNDLKQDDKLKIEHKNYKFSKYIEKNKKNENKPKKIDKRNAYKPNNILFYISKPVEKKILPLPEERTKTKCFCQATKCIKLYCECFNSGKYCIGCDCVDCFNIPEYDDIRSKAIDHLEKKNKVSDISKLTKKEENIVERGCKCKTSKCLKNYCECFQVGLGCSSSCKCLNCQNDGIKAKKLKSKPKPIKISKNKDKKI